MGVIFFALFFIIYLSLFYLGPSVIEKKLTKVSRKKKIDNINKDYFMYAVITVLYVIVYLIMYNTYAESIRYIVNRGLPHIYNNNLFLLGAVAFVYLLITSIYTVYTFILSSKLFTYKKNNEAYIIVGITALFSILAYYSFYTILNLGNYSFDNNIFLNTIYQFDYDIAPYLYFVIVLLQLGISFIKE